MLKIQNLGLARKLTMAFGGAMLFIAIVATLGIWSLHAVAAAVNQSKAEAEKMLLVRQYSGYTARLVLYSAMSLMRGKMTDQDAAEFAALRKNYGDVYGQLSKEVTLDEGRRLMDIWNKQGAAAKAANLRVAELNKSGRRAEAAKVFLGATVPAYETQDHTIEKFLQWQEGQLTASEQQRSAAISRATNMMTIATLIVFAGCALAGFLLTRSIAKPLTAAVAHMNAIAQGDVSRDVPGEFLDRLDEIGLLGRSMQAMSASLRRILSDIAEGVAVVSSSSAQLSAHSSQMTEGSHEAFDKAHALASTACEMKDTVVSVAAGMEQTSRNLTGVTSATEQMTSTIGEIAANSERARRITDDANREAAGISRQMTELGAAAREIGKVTETITEISSQTNLLALNATIEAARAGVAGKGFAVVANEIKALAQQTSAATEDIKTRIAGVQSSAAAGIAEIGKVSQVIRDVSEIVTSIAAAIEEQSTVTRDIALNIVQASAGVQEANQRVGEISQATLGFASDISGVDRSSRNMAEGSEQVKTSAAELATVAARLETTARRFKV